MEQSIIRHREKDAITITKIKIENHGGFKNFIQRKSRYADDIIKQEYYCQDGAIVVCDHLHDNYFDDDLFSIYVIDNTRE